MYLLYFIEINHSNCFYCVKSTFSVLRPGFEILQKKQSLFGPYQHITDLRNHWAVTAYMIILGMEDTSTISTLASCTESENWCSIQHRSSKTSGFWTYFTNRQIYRLSSLKGKEMTTWATVARSDNPGCRKCDFTKTGSETQLQVFFMNMKWSTELN